MEQTALAIIQKEAQAGNLVYVRPEDLKTARMFVAQVTVIPAIQGGFHEKPIQGRYMPKAHHVDRIGEAAGIEFIAAQCGTRKEGERTYVGFAQGRRRMPDGTWRSSTKQEYEFDVDVRAEEDFLKDSRNTYGTEIAKRKHVIDLQKVARQRASTGARLRVIRELTGIPIAFGPDDFKRALVVSRIAVNSDAMLDDPNTREAAISMAIGSTADVFGPSKEAAQIEAPAEIEAEPVLDMSGAVEVAVESDDGFGDEPATEGERLDHQLEEYLLDDVVGADTKRADLIRAALKSEDLEEKRKMIDRCDAYRSKAATV